MYDLKKKPIKNYCFLKKAHFSLALQWAGADNSTLIKSKIGPDHGLDTPTIGTL